MKKHILLKIKLNLMMGLYLMDMKKIYLNAIEEEFNKYPEVVRENVNSITIVRKPKCFIWIYL